SGLSSSSRAPCHSSRVPIPCTLICPSFSLASSPPYRDHLMSPGASPKLIAHHVRGARYELFYGEGSMTQGRVTRRWRTAVAAAAVGGVLLQLAPSAPAGHGVPPATVLHAGGRSQRGGLVWEDWTSRSGNTCVQSGGDGTG